MGQEIKFSTVGVPKKNKKRNKIMFSGHNSVVPERAPETA